MRGAGACWTKKIHAKMQGREEKATTTDKRRFTQMELRLQGGLNADIRRRLFTGPKRPRLVQRRPFTFQVAPSSPPLPLCVFAPLREISGLHDTPALFIAHCSATAHHLYSVAHALRSDVISAHRP
jgi:hypothetical protein